MSDTNLLSGSADSLPNLAGVAATLQGPDNQQVPFNQAPEVDPNVAMIQNTSDLITSAQAAAAWDRQNSQNNSGGNMLTDAADGLTNFAIKGVPLTAASIMNSFLNTATEVTNFMGYDSQKATIQDEFGKDSESSQYYDQHTGLIEGLGLAVGSLIPGTGATKLLKVAQLGKFGEALAAGTGLLSGIRDEAIASASVDLVENATGQSVFGITTANKVRAILAGIGDQALQGAAYQTATIATMHASPLIDNNTMMDNLADIRDAAIGFGVVGGLIDGAGAVYKINKAVRAADLATNNQSAIGLLGKGAMPAGDRILKLYDTLDSIPPATNPLGQMKYNNTVKLTTAAIQNHMLQLASGDADLAGTFYKYITDGRANGTIGSDELENNLSLLSKIGRHSDTRVVSQPQDVYYIPKAVDTGVVPYANSEDVLHPRAAPELNTQNSPAYVLTQPDSLPVIHRESDVLTLPAVTPGTNDIVIKRYNDPQDSFNHGGDIFISSNGQVHINPVTTALKEVPRPGESRILSSAEREVYNNTGQLPTNSAPFNAVGLTLDTVTNKIFGDSPLPVVGDLGKPSLSSTKTELTAGNKTFINNPGDVLDTSNPMNANARYAWAAMRGVKVADKIDPSDLPMMEQAYRQMITSPNIKTFPAVFSDGTSFPQTSMDMLRHIANLKQDKYIDLLAAGKNADEIGHILNAPVKGLTDNFNTLDPDMLMTPPEQNTNIRHIRFAYDISSVKDDEGNLLRGMQATNYKTALANNARTDQVSDYLNKVLGTDTDATNAFHGLQFTKGAGDADLLGAGRGFLTNANADYGTLAQQAERIGVKRSGISIKLRSTINDTITSFTNKLRQNPALANEFGNIRTVMQSTGEKFMFIPDELAEDTGIPKNSLVLRDAVTQDAESGTYKYDPDYVPEGFTEGDNTGGSGGAGLKTVYTLSDDLVDGLKAHQSLVNARNSLRANWWKATGVPKDNYDPEILYMPPIDTTKAPFFAYVREREGMIAGESGGNVITARSAAELQQKIALLGPNFDTFTDKDLKGYFRAKGEFDYNRSFGNSRVDTEMKRKGILNNIVPETRAANLIDDLVNWHYRQADLLLNDHVELLNSPIFDQLKAAGDRFETSGTSRKGFLARSDLTNINNPYQSYINTALGISPKSGLYPMWMAAQEKLQAFGDTAFNTARAALGGLQKGLISPEAAAKMSEKFGLGNPYGTAIKELQRNYYGGLANQLPDPRLLSKFVHTANTVMNATVIRLDTFQQLIHAVTVPIMTALEHGVATREIQQLMNVTVPGTQQQVPGWSRTLYNAVRNYFGPNKEQLMNLYSTAGGGSYNELKVADQLTSALAMPKGSLDATAWNTKMQSAIEKGSWLSGSNFTNKFIHFISSDVGRQIAEAQGQVGQDLLDSIGTFTHRVLGNVSAGQRAGIFAGPVGNAIGLFKSFQWNMMQQLFRHIGEGNVKQLAMAAGMQSSIFGLSSLPGFHALDQMIMNNHSNPQKSDIYSATASSIGKSDANYLLYGALSGLTGSSLYTRGDINPRQLSILPLNPLQFPSVSAGIKVYQNIAQLASNISTQGGNVPASLLIALEHNGLSRPLSGLAELMQGFSTSSNGSLISTNPGLSDLFSVASMSRILGAKPLEEGIAMDGLYRLNAAKVLDTARMNTLGSALKTALYNNSNNTAAVSQQFLADYVKAGGTQANFNQWFLSQYKSANVSAFNKAMMNFHSPSSQSLQQLMGGQALPDFRNASTQVGNTAGNNQQTSYTNSFSVAPPMVQPSVVQ